MPGCACAQTLEEPPEPGRGRWAHGFSPLRTSPVRGQDFRGVDCPWAALGEMLISREKGAQEPRLSPCPEAIPRSRFRNLWTTDSQWGRGSLPSPGPALYKVSLSSRFLELCFQSPRISSPLPHHPVSCVLLLSFSVSKMFYADKEQGGSRRCGGGSRDRAFCSSLSVCSCQTYSRLTEGGGQTRMQSIQGCHFCRPYNPLCAPRRATLGWE